MHEEKLKDVYVTDHVPKTKQLLTTSEEEDAQYYAYMKSLSDYKKKVGHTKRYLNHLESGKYARGSMLQRVFEPLAGSIKQDNGTIFLEILDKDVTLDTDESKARQRYELLKNDEASMLRATVRTPELLPSERRTWKATLMPTLLEPKWRTSSNPSSRERSTMW